MVSKTPHSVLKRDFLRLMLCVVRIPTDQSVKPINNSHSTPILSFYHYPFIL